MKQIFCITLSECDSVSESVSLKKQLGGYDKSHIEFQLLSTIPSINHTHLDPNYAISSSHDFASHKTVHDAKAK